MEQHWWSLPDLVDYLGEVHRDAEVRYRRLAATRSANPLSRRLLTHLADRESRLARHMDTLAPCPDIGRRLSLSTPLRLEIRCPPADNLGSAAIIDLATSHESHVEQVIAMIADTFASQPVIGPYAEQLVELHRRELFDLGALADKLLAMER